MIRAICWAIATGAVNQVACWIDSDDSVLHFPLVALQFASAAAFVCSIGWVIFEAGSWVVSHL